MAFAVRFRRISEGLAGQRRGNKSDRLQRYCLRPDDTYVEQFNKRYQSIARTERDGLKPPETAVPNSTNLRVGRSNRSGRAILGALSSHLPFKSTSLQGRSERTCGLGVVPHLHPEVCETCI